MRLLSFVFVLLFSCSSYSASVDMSNPNQVIHSVSTQTLARISAEKARMESEPGYTNVVIEEELIPYFDYKYAAYMVLGKYLKQSTKDQRNNFVDAFRNYLVNTYGHILFEYDHQKVEVLENPNFQGKKIIAIDVRIRDDQGQVTKLAFKLRKNKKTAEWKVYDVIAEGVSMLNTKRSELDELLRKNGIDHVIELLKSKNQELAS